MNTSAALNMKNTQALLSNDLAEVQLGLFLGLILSTQTGIMRKVKPTNATSNKGMHNALVLQPEGADGFILGSTDEGETLLGVMPSIGHWFVDIGWEFAVVSRERYLRLSTRLQDERFEVAIPLTPAIHSNMPKGKNQLLLAAVIQDDDGEHELTHRRLVPYYNASQN